MSNTIENNKLIAEFMGVEFMNINIFKNRLPKDFIEHSENYECFHNSWNWLISVVEKVAHIKRFNNIKSDLLDMKINSKIDDVHSACIEFIKYYNQQSKL